MADRLVKLRKIGYKPLIDVHVTANPTDPLESVLKVSRFFLLILKINFSDLFFFKIKQPSWLFNKQYYNKPEFESAYKDYLFKFVNFLNPDFKREDERIDSIFEIEKQFAMVSEFFLLAKTLIFIAFE